MTIGLYWNEVPRAFGNPLQEMVYDSAFLKFMIDDNNGKNPVYISHNSFPQVDRFGSPITVRVSKIFKDLDNEKKPENSLLDARLLARKAIDEDIPFAVAFSGSKGFHFYHLLSPEEYPANSDLENAIRAVQLWWRGLGEWDDKKRVYKKHIRNDDERVIGDWRRLCKVWGSQYAKYDQNARKVIMKKTHCIPLTHEMLFDWTFPEIVNFSKNYTKKYKIDFVGTKEQTLKEFMDEYDIKHPKYDIANVKYSTKTIDFTNIHNEAMKKMFVDPCLYNQMLSDNPTHNARFAIVVYLKDVLKMSQGQVFDLFQSRNWVDKHNTDVCNYQINQIFGRDYHRPKRREKICEWLSRKGLCIGDSCEIYRRRDNE
jgi:hypothetical protein